MYGKIQWLAENLYEEGNCKFYEACSLESITNAVRKYTKMGVLTRKEGALSKKGKTKVTYCPSPEYQNDDEKINELYDGLI